MNAGKIVAQQLITAAGGLALVGIFIFYLITTLAGCSCRVLNWDVIDLVIETYLHFWREK